MRYRRAVHDNADAAMDGVLALAVVGYMHPQGYALGLVKPVTRFRDSHFLPACLNS